MAATASVLAAVAATTTMSSVGSDILGLAVGDAVSALNDSMTHPTAAAVLEEIDLYAVLETVEALVAELPRFDEEQEEEEDGVETTEKHARRSTLHVCLQNVRDIIEKIRHQLELINAERFYHQSRWLADWRSPHFAPYLSALRRYKKILDSRVDMLMKVMHSERTIAQLRMLSPPSSLSDASKKKPTTAMVESQSFELMSEKAT
eukprot:TRINITY_DN226_c4_g1_i2.p1 TRINITY_DN226_c4_g1~~TRINITY_DN226_c4_g1_i2.p1  ORF type:complete len:205 (-),score=64.12 TRINITY_DN226_c4_g1_i2:34-648(-)